MNLNWKMAMATGMLILTSVAAQAQLEWRLSAKVFVDAAPTVAQTTNLTAIIEGWVSHANSVYPRHTRGYRVRLTEIEFVINATWSRRVPSADNRDELQSDASDDPARFRWRTDAINLYVTQPTVSSTFGGYCSRPGDEVIILRDDTGNGTLVHELGHFFDLCHTHGCSCGPCDPNNSCIESDDIVDTLSDSACWENNDGTADLDRISSFNFNSDYNGLPASSQQLVQNVAVNIMSYHSGAVLFTPRQFDRMTDASNDDRRNVVNGLTWFVSIDGANDALYGYYSWDPVQSATEGVNRARSGEVVLLRAGTYPFIGTGWTITKPVTLRATRGNASIRRAFP